MLKHIDPRRLSLMMGLPDAPDMLIWPEDDRAALFRHQMRVPLFLTSSTGVCHTAPGNEALERTGDAEDCVSSWHRLLTERTPSLAALGAAKDFAKANTRGDEPSVPRELATVLYYAVIAAALVRRGERMTSLDDASLRTGFRWGLDQSWVEEPVTELFESGLAILDRA